MMKSTKFRAAAIQTAPVYLNREATVEKAVALLTEAASAGANLVVFPETFVPGYPYWVWLETPLKGGPWFRRLHDQSVDLHGPHLRPLQERAKSLGVTVVIGINERNPRNHGAIYNTNVVIGSDGGILGAHRKLALTWAEKLIWTAGDGSTLRIYDTEIGAIGTLACGENTNTLARFALLAMGEMIHASNYPAFPFTKNFDITRGIQTRAGAHALEGKIYNVVSCSTLSPEIVATVADTPELEAMMSGHPNACSGIFGPDGMPITDLLIDDEGIVYGDIDLDRCYEAKLLHDILGNYNRFDVFDLRINRRQLAPIRIQDRFEEDAIRLSRGDEPTTGDGREPAFP